MLKISIIKKSDTFLSFRNGAIALIFISINSVRNRFNVENWMDLRNINVKGISHPIGIRNEKKRNI